MYLALKFHQKSLSMDELTRAMCTHHPKCETWNEHCARNGAYKTDFQRQIDDAVDRKRAELQRENFIKQLTAACPNEQIRNDIIRNYDEQRKPKCPHCGQEMKNGT